MIAGELATALAACASGLYPLEAGVALLISSGAFLHRSDFAGRFIEHATNSGTAMAAIDWEAAVTALNGGELPCSAGERRLLLLSASLAGGIPVDLRDAATGLDGQNIQRLITAIRHASGKRPESRDIDDRSSSMLVQPITTSLQGIISEMPLGQVMECLVREPTLAGQSSATLTIMALTDFIFLDQARIDSYYEQISAGKTRKRLVPTFTVNLGIPPSVTLQASAQAIDASLAAKYRKVVGYFRENDLLGDRRAGLELENEVIVPFRQETCQLRPVIISPRDEPGLHRGLRLWVSENRPGCLNGRSHFLYLIENFPADDEAENWTGWTLLEVLSRAHVWPGARFLGNANGSANAIPGQLSMLRLFEELGAHIGSPKLVNVVYRVRIIFLEQLLMLSPSTVGYPIGITQDISPGPT